MKIGVLALQGDFAEHIGVLEEEGIESLEIRQKKDLSNGMDALILPGGESTVMRKLIRDLGLLEPLREMIAGGLPVLGTCAGLILLAERISGGEEPCFACMDMTVRRNAYGRQPGSFETKANFKGIGSVSMTFIRGPYIESVGEKAEILARADGRIVAARQENMLATAFHPELAREHEVHRYFAAMTERRVQKRTKGESV